MLGFRRPPIRHSSNESMPVSEREKLISLFRHLKDLDGLRIHVPKSVETHPGHLWWKEIPAHSSMLRGALGDEVLLEVKRSTERCPAPPEPLLEWLRPGWDDPLQEVQAVPTRDHVSFQDDPARAEALQHWLSVRQIWQAAETTAKAFYDRVISWLSDIDREGERLELFLGVGLLERVEEKVCHPLLLERITLEFDMPSGSAIFRRTTEAPEVNLSLLRTLDGVDMSSVRQFAEQLPKENLDLFSAESIQPVEVGLGQVLGASLAHEPVLLLCRRSLGYQQAVSRILLDLESGREPSNALLHLTGLRNEAATTAPAGLVAGDDSFYLSKPANEEQLRIVRRLGRNDAVLVQGPPGTGKTHTIANLVGHLLAEGKKVLVTAHTSKALRVLRNMVARPLQSLCVSVQDNDTDNRMQLNETIRDMNRRLAESDTEALQKEAIALEAQRATLQDQIRKLRKSSHEARWSESRPFEVLGRTWNLKEGAAFLQEGAEHHGWLPGPITPGSVPPLSAHQIADLYRCNALLSHDDEVQLAAPLPDPGKLMSAAEFALCMAEQTRLSASAAKDRKELWLPTDPPVTVEWLDHLLPRVRVVANSIKDAPNWMLEVVRAGRQRGVTRQIWEDLVEQVEQLARVADEAQPQLLSLDLQIQPQDPAEARVDDTATLADICTHVKGGGALGLWTRTTKRPWHRLIDRCRVDGESPEKLEHFQALLAFSKLRLARDAFRTRWQRQVNGAGGPDSSTLGPMPEKSALVICGDIRSRLDWYTREWAPLEAELSAIGFQWAAYASEVLAHRSEYGEMARLRAALDSGIEEVVRSHRDAMRLDQIRTHFLRYVEDLRSFASHPVGHRLLQAVDAGDATEYALAGRELARLQSLVELAGRRRDNLAKLESEAPGWGAALRSRQAPHDGTQVPGEVEAAWKWRQFEQEWTARFGVVTPDESGLAADLEASLCALTARLVECKAWAGRRAQVTPTQQAALEGYVACLGKMSKSGQGRRDAALMTSARDHLRIARGAVPVWIMPLARVYEQLFSAVSPDRFDVVIIDEASQSDLCALAAVYLGSQVIVVGDEEQVTPTPFAEGEQMQQLIAHHLDGIPNRDLYDLETSVYHLARAFLQERVLLREHFRSVPEIIQFSNDLSYGRNIRPLRESQSSPVQPTLVGHRAPTGFVRGRVNPGEAEEIVSLIMACLEQPEYATNHLGETATFGVISMVGDEQSSLIESLLQGRIPADDLERRRILCGNAAQFQGDERDVMFLSLVDSAEGSCLPLRGFGPKDIFRKRYNVAASRARNQLWVVHSFDVDRELQAADMRRRLISHACNPEPLLKRMDSTDIVVPEFDREVRNYLVAHQYDVQAQWPAGTARISLVVRQGKNRLAVECDGGRLMREEELEHDGQRQRALERMGWRFVRVRASEFYLNPDRAMQPVLEALAAKGITPQHSPAAVVSNADQGHQSLLRVLRRAEELREMWSSRVRQRELKRQDEENGAASRRVPQKEKNGAPEPQSPVSNGVRVIVEPGDWVEFILLDAPSEPQLINIISGATDLERSAISMEEPLAKALLGRSVQEIGKLHTADLKHDLKILQIHKPAKLR